MKLITIYRKAQIFLIVDSLFKQMTEFTFPLKVNDLLKFFRKYYNIKIIKFTDFASISGKTLSKTATFFCTNNARIIYDPRSNTYYIYFNDTMPKNRCRWNIVHELSHLYLNHVITKINAVNSDIELPETAYNEMEEEANYFTSCCLAPYPVIISLSCYYKMIHFKGYYTILRTFFGLSKEASYYIAKKLSPLKNFYLDKQALQPYKKYLIDILDTYPQDLFSSPSFLKYQEEIPRIMHIINQKKLNKKFTAHYFEFYTVEDIIEIMLKKESIKWNQAKAL